MVMIGWIDRIIAFLAVSSALLLVLGALSYLVMRLLKVRGKPTLWICTILILMPLIYPLQAFLPDAVRVPIPMPTLMSPASEPVVTGTVETTLPEAGIGQRPSPAVPSGASAGSAISGTGSTSTRPMPWKLLAASAWILPLFFFLLRSLLMVYNTMRLPKYARPVNDPAVLELLRQCAAETGVRKAPELRRTNPLSTPMVMGFLRPTILLPEHLLTAPFQEGLRFTLLHELKHLKRRDNWWLLVESVVGAVYFFHPVIHWAKKRIHEEWEYLCDHHVIRITRKSASYADFLLHEVRNHGRGAPHPATAVPFIAPGVSKTARRVRSILENSASTFFSKLRGSLAVGVVSVSFLSLLAFTATSPVREETATANPIDIGLNALVEETVTAAPIDTSLNALPEETATAAPIDTGLNALPEETVTAAPIDTGLKALPEETAPAPAVAETETVSIQPPVDEVAPVSTPPASTLPQASSTDSSRTAGETRQAKSTAPLNSAMLATGSVTPKIAAESDASATSPAPGRPNTQDVAAPITQDAAVPPRPSVSPASMPLAENDTLLPEKEAHVVKTVPAVEGTAADKYSNLDNQLEQVSDISSFNMMNWDWEAVDNRSFILHTSPGRHYLILLRRPAHGLMFGKAISISNIGAKVKPGDWVTVFDPSQGVSIIHKIFKLEDRKMVTQIRDQLS